MALRGFKHFKEGDVVRLVTNHRDGQGYVELTAAYTHSEHIVLVKRLVGMPVLGFYYRGSFWQGTEGTWELTDVEIKEDISEWL